MRKLIERFYKLSLVKRMIILILAIFLISVATVLYSFYNLTSAVKKLMGNNSEPFKPMQLSQLNERVKGKFVPDHVTTAIDSLDSIQDLSNKIKLTKKKATDPDFDFSKLNQQQMIELRQDVEAFNRLKWEELFLFATSQVDPFASEAEMINLRKVNNASKLMRDYLVHFNRVKPEESSQFIFSAILKLARFTEITSPYLIGKMIALAVNNNAVKPFNRYAEGNGDVILPKDSILDKNLIKPAEASELKSLLLTSLKMEVPFRRFLESEYSFFKHFSAKIYEKAPLAANILFIIFGNPNDEYRKIIDHPADKELLKKTLHGWKHPALIVAVPNFTKAFQIFNQRQAQRAVLAAELADLAGETQSIPDPFSESNIRSLEVDGKLKFYSVGPNGLDDKMSKDDISLYKSE